MILLTVIFAFYALARSVDLAISNRAYGATKRPVCYGVLAVAIIIVLVLVIFYRSSIPLYWR